MQVKTTNTAAVANHSSMHNLIFYWGLHLPLLNYVGVSHLSSGDSLNQPVPLVQQGTVYDLKYISLNIAICKIAKQVQYHMSCRSPVLLLCRWGLV